MKRQTVFMSINVNISVPVSVVSHESAAGLNNSL